MSRVLALSLWSVLAVCVGTGCIPVTVPTVEQSLTTGERLRAMRTVREAPPLVPDPRESSDPFIANDVRAPAPTPKEVDDLRAWLLATIPWMGAGISAAGPPPTIADYPDLNPALYESVETERRDLQRALEARVISQAEFDEFCRLLDDQARRSIVRHRDGDLFVSSRFIASDTRSWYGYAARVPTTPKSRMEAAVAWVEWEIDDLRAHPERSSVPPALDPSTGFRPTYSAWYKASIWINPKLPPSAEPPATSATRIAPSP